MAREPLTAYDVRDEYDEAYYRALSRSYEEANRFSRQRIENVLTLLPPVEGKRLVDLGCGMGTFTLEAASRGAEAVGIDFTAAAVREAERIAREHRVPGASFVQGDAAVLPLPDASVDVMVAADFTEHLDDETLRRILSEAGRVLAPGGALVLYTPSPSHLLERLRGASFILKPYGSHIGLRSADVLAREVERAGLRVRRIAYLPSHLPGLKQVERLLGRWVPLLRRRIGLVASKPGRP